MKTILFSLILTFASANAFAMGGVVGGNLNFAGESEWSKGKVRRACGIEVKKSDKGVMTEMKSNGRKVYVYTVYSAEGDMVAQAAAYSDAVWVKATCQD